MAKNYSNVNNSNRNSDAKNSSSYGDSQNKNRNAAKNSNSRSKMSDSRNCGRNEADEAVKTFLLCLTWTLTARSCHFARCCIRFRSSYVSKGDVPFHG